MTSVTNNTDEQTLTDTTMLYAQESHGDSNDSIEEKPLIGNKQFNKSSSNKIKRRKSSLSSIPKDLISHLRRLNPSSYHERININENSNSDTTTTENIYDRYNKFYEEKSNRHYENKNKNGKTSSSSHTNYQSAPFETDTIDNWTHTINDYWLRDTKIEDIEFEDSSDEDI
ncbi:similar to Saccharomyces cerevisiae YHR136C SPL2 Protein with similarity to cyclin-dependent kinase inhibitors [Maudiozyma barnettii]|uniref:Similar to Saccharomyces cerevisiae YHR136C SPL2 Protein with similarity to cyclin-dependent kinase inhibitors n=1 Tax=Maudiozyma barnettii TaxID=61262 RepID=A0A8H2VHN5_9SACH|nr:uncharacterized protein KABA2_07S01276 [Kazachstania barnettii]CAB4255646.1 similar to Saccharomyces cerevisiae YHR136C SPL2 Protein with similarity to cyclin-dependent kinase inhibitors [Kazachstania barnettii]CAD1784207.1 similar to Saccharomyces cerevisiae YHR136C SPL2 Protein with similarity to cyclin-dependent kinase inhibitors [Kazachstania barnettii]